MRLLNPRYWKNCEETMLRGYDRAILRFAERWATLIEKVFDDLNQLKTCGDKEDRKLRNELISEAKKNANTENISEDMIMEAIKILISCHVLKTNIIEWLDDCYS